MTTTRYRYRAHGLIIASELELALPAAPPDSGAPDLLLRLGPERHVPPEPPPGRGIAGLIGRDGRVFYRLGGDADRSVLRYPGLADFTGDAGLSDIVIHPNPGVDHGLLAVLVAGTVLAVHLTLAGHLVLHASAVRLNGHAVAFVGASGMGKSTVAAALCGIGCGLVADDVVRVDQHGPGGLRVYPGSTEARLRQSASALADAAPRGAARPTADGRLALRAPAVAEGPLPLAACVVPRPSREAATVSVNRLAPMRALLRMTQFPRVAGWCEPASQGRLFQALADLVERVPVFEATIPWGPPFAPETLAELLDAVGAGQR